MPTFKIILMICIQVISLLVIAYAGQLLGFVLFIAGLVPLADSERLSFWIAYLYFPLNGLLFATGVICLIMEADVRNNRLAFTGREFGFKVLKLWRIQNALVALLCIYVYLMSIAYLEGRLEHLL